MTSNLFEGLKNPRTIRAIIVYIVAAWLLVQIADATFEPMGLPPPLVKLVVFLAVAGLPLAIALGWIRNLRSAADEGVDAEPADPAISDGAQSQELSGADRPPSVAIVPFVDLSVDHDCEQFADGLTRVLIRALSGLSGMKMASWISCFALKGKDVHARKVRKKLKVSHVVEGSISKVADELQITAQVVETATDSILWAESYERRLADIFDIQQDIGLKTAHVLSLRVPVGDLRPDVTSNAEAYEYYLRGRGYFMRTSATNLAHAVTMFSRATELDPLFAQAWSDLARTYALQAIYYEGSKAERKAAHEASEKAVDLAPDSAGSHAARGIAHLASQSYDAAARSFETAIQLDPGLWSAYHNYGRSSFHQGRMRKAIELFEKASEVNPDDYQSPVLAAPLYQALGDEESFQRNAAKGVRRAEWLIKNFPDHQRAYYMGAMALMYLGKRDRALRWAEKSLAIDPLDPAIRYNMGCFYARAGEIDKAFECLDDSITSRTWVENDPDLESLREDPRYHNLLRKLED
jgi:adenylate cyclase